MLDKDALLEWSLTLRHFETSIIVSILHAPPICLRIRPKEYASVTKDCLKPSSSTRMQCVYV